MKVCPVEAELFFADGRTDRQTDMIWRDRIVVFFQIFSYTYCSMGAGTLMMLTPGGISIELHHTNILARLGTKVCFTY